MAFLSHLIYGLQLGAIYALVALGYSMVYGIIRLINFAHGDIIMVASFVVWYLIARLNVPVWLSILICVAFTSLLGVAIEKLAYKPLRHSARISLLITAIGISFFLQNAAQLIFGADPVMFENLFPGNLTLGTLTVSRVSVIIICVSIVLMVALVLLVNKTRMGRAMRAVSEDEGTAALMGINVNTTIPSPSRSARRWQPWPPFCIPAPIRKFPRQWAACWVSRPLLPPCWEALAPSRARCLAAS